VRLDELLNIALTCRNHPCAVCCIDLPLMAGRCVACAKACRLVRVRKTLADMTTMSIATTSLKTAVGKGVVGMRVGWGRWDADISIGAGSCYVGWCMMGR
jgi:hypothetical protein